MEKIKSAAIKYRLKGDTEFKYVVGNSHADCIMSFAMMNMCTNQRDINVEEQGFMTTENRFVGRTEALKIARDNDQLINPILYPYDILYSEYVRYSN